MTCQCIEELKKGWAKLGYKVTITDEPNPILGVIGAGVMCDHGTAWWYTPTATNEQDPCGCGAVLKEKRASHGIESTVSAQPPLVINEWTYAGFSACPHGVLFFAEPTNEQKIKYQNEAS